MLSARHARSNEENGPARIDFSNLLFDRLTSLRNRNHYRPRMLPDPFAGLLGGKRPACDCDFLRIAIQHNHIGHVGQRSTVFHGPTEIVTSAPDQDTWVRRELG